MKRLDAKGSLQQLGVGVGYQKESERNFWNNIIITKEHGILPVDVWRQKVATGLGYSFSKREAKRQKPFKETLVNSLR